MKKKESPVVQFIRLAWENASTGVPHSWERINHTMRNSMMLALGAFEFKLDDYELCLNGKRPGYWCDHESCYTVAIVNGNTSACVSIENYLDRVPLIADNVKMSTCYSGANLHLVGDRQKERLHVGAKFCWRGEDVTVTSFSKDGSAIACSYKPKPESVNCEKCGAWLSGGSGVAKILHRYTINRDDIIAERAERKRRGEIQAELIKTTSPSQRVAALAAIRVVTQSDFDRVSIAKLEKVLANLQEANPLCQPS